MATATKTKDAVSLLKEDHRKVKNLFDQFEEASDKEKEQICEEVIKELKIHSAIEEEIFYPAMRQSAKDEELMDEAEEEHRVAKTLIEDLEKAKSSAEHFEAKFMVLAESVRHHIKEEEKEMFKEAKKADVDLEELGEKMMARKEELMSNESALEEAGRKSHIKPYQELGV